MVRSAVLARLAVVATNGCALLVGGLHVEAVQHTVMTLAAYSGKMDISDLNLQFVNTLRGVGFAGNIFLGLWEGTKDATLYLERNRVTPKYIRHAECQLPYEEEGNTYIGKVCTEEFPHIKLDNARWYYARRWLRECSSCSGWVLYADFGDINFQRDPFTSLPAVGSVPPETVYLTEEMRPRTDRLLRLRGVSTSHWLVQSAVLGCYGPVKGLRNISMKPMINIASTFGTRAGMLRWLGRLEEEFERLSSNKKCDPVKISDQAILNHLFYNEGEMPYATPQEYGKWIVNTMGVPCSNAKGHRPEHSLNDIAIIDRGGLVWNEDGTLPAVIHQGKVCHSNYLLPHIWHQFGGVSNVSKYSDELRDMMEDATFPGRRDE